MTEEGQAKPAEAGGDWSALRPPFSAVLLWSCRLLLAAVYLAAAWPKIADPAGFARSIFNYQLLPDALINPLALFLPWLELFAALALLAVTPLRRGALQLIAAMTVVFIGAIASAMARGIDIDCGCFSTTGEGMRTGWLHLVLDFALLALCVAHVRVEGWRPRRRGGG